MNPATEKYCTICVGTFKSGRRRCDYSNQEYICYENLADIFDSPKTMSLHYGVTSCGVTTQSWTDNQHIINTEYHKKAWDCDKCFPKKDSDQEVHPETNA